MVRLVAAPRLPGAESVMAGRRAEPGIATHLLPGKRRAAVVARPERLSSVAVPAVDRRLTATLSESRFLPCAPKADLPHVLAELLGHAVAGRPSARSVAPLVVVAHVARPAHCDSVVRVKSEVGTLPLRNQVASVKTPFASALLALARSAGDHCKPPRPEQFGVRGAGLNRNDVGNRCIHASSYPTRFGQRR